MCHVIHIYRRISAVPYQSVIPNSHQVPCNGFQMSPRCQPRCKPRCQRDVSRDSRRDVSSDSSIYNIVHCLSAVVMFSLPLRAPDVINGTLLVRRAIADPPLQCSSTPCSYPVIIVINIGSSVPSSSSVPRRSGSYVMFVIRIWYVQVLVAPWDLVLLGYITNIACNTILLW